MPPNDACAVTACPLCGSPFSRMELIQLSTLAPKGMLHVPAGDGEPALTGYYFTHTDKGCGTTFVMPVATFNADLAEEVPVPVLFATSVCKRHCASLVDLHECHQPCGNAPYRRFLLLRLLPRR